MQCGRHSNETFSIVDEVHAYCEMLCLFLARTNQKTFTAVFFCFGRFSAPFLIEYRSMFYIYLACMDIIQEFNVSDTMH